MKPQNEQVQGSVLKALSKLMAFLTVVAFVSFHLTTSASAEPIDALSSPATDHKNHIAFLGMDGVPRVTDIASGDSISVTGSDGCTPEDILGNLLLLSCPGPKDDGVFQLRFSHRLADITTGESRLFVKEGYVHLYVLGKYWAAGRADSCGVSPHCTGDAYVNRKTGQYKAFFEGSRYYPDRYAQNRKKLWWSPNLPDFPFGPKTSPVAWDRNTLVSDNGRKMVLWQKGRPKFPFTKSLGFCCYDVPEATPNQLAGGQFVWRVYSDELDPTGEFQAYTDWSLDLATRKKRRFEFSDDYGAVSPFPGGVIRWTADLSAEPRTYRIEIVRFGP